MGAIVIYSGGLDSTVLLYKICGFFREVKAINFFYGSKHNTMERARAIVNCQRLKIELLEIDISAIACGLKSSLLMGGDPIPEGHYQAENMRSTVVPFRNGILLSIAAGIAESNDCEHIFYGAHSGDHYIYPDCRPEFVGIMGLAIREGTGGKVILHAPFVNLKKSDIVTLGNSIGVPFNLTWTCYKGEDLHCGKCGACVERKEAFRLSGIIDPTIYKE